LIALADHPLLFVCDFPFLFRDKEGIFCPAVSLLGIFVTHDTMIKKFCKKHENLKRLCDICTLSIKKLKYKNSTSNRRNSYDARARKATNVGACDMAKATSALKKTIEVLKED